MLTSYLCTIAGDGEGNPLTNFLDEEAGGSSRAEFRMKVISEETWMKAARRGFRNPKAAKPTPSRPNSHRLQICAENKQFLTFNDRLYYYTTIKLGPVSLHTN